MRSPLNLNHFSENIDMRVLPISTTEIDLAAQKHQFVSNGTLVVANLTAGSLTIQESDVSGSGFTTLATIAAGVMQEVKLNKQYIKLSSAGTVYAIAN